MINFPTLTMPEDFREMSKTVSKRILLIFQKMVIKIITETPEEKILVRIIRNGITKRSPGGRKNNQLFGFSI